MQQRVLALAAIALLIATAAPADGLFPPPPTPPPTANLVVGFDGRYVNLTLLTSAGATVTGTSDALGIAAIYAPDPTSLTATLLLHPEVAWVEANAATHLESSQWDSSQWDSSQWDSSQWDASGWDSSQWDSSQWDASGWDSSQWDSSQWDSSQWDSSQWDSSQWDASGWDATGFNRTTMEALGSAQGAIGTDPLVPWQWAIAALNLSRAATLGPATQTICFVDSGVDHTHPDLAPRFVGGYDFVNKDNDAMDDGGHGTHVAGIAAAMSGNGLGITGAAPARISAAKVLDATGTGHEFELALGIDWCRANGADVISMSLSTDQNAKAVHRAVVDAFAQGIVLVASAGNTGASCDCVRYPAAYPQVVSVGAVMPNSGRAPFSAVSRGVDLVAPGYAILSTLPNGGYGAASGTSQAAPYVSAAIALLLAAGADGQEATQALRDTAIDLGVDGYDPAFGYGSVNVGAALASLYG